MKLKIIIPLLMMFVFMMSSVSAISILSVSNPTFESNSNLYSEGAFIIAGVENGGQDEVTWQIAELETRLPEGFTMTNNGYIKSQITPLGFSYPVNQVDVTWRARVIGFGERFWIARNAEDWCYNDLGGHVVAEEGGIQRWTCVEIYPGGLIYDLSPGTYDYDLKYTLYSSTDGTDTISLDINNGVRSAGSMIGSKNFFQVTRATYGTSATSDPDIDDKLWLHYSFTDSKWRYMKVGVSTYPVSFQSTQNHFKDCLRSWIFGSGTPSNCINDWNVEVVNWANTNRYVGSARTDLFDFSKVSTSTFSGSLKYNDGNVYRDPIVTIVINADKVGVKRVFGEPFIKDIDYPANMVIGQSGNIQIVVQNVGDANMDATLNMDCRDYYISGISTRFGLDAGQTKTLSGTIKYTGTVNGCTTGSTCKLTLVNSDASFISPSTKSFTPKVCQVSECSVQGKTDCLGNTIRRCDNVGGVLKYVTAAQCQLKCVYNAQGNAECDDNVDPTCGDGICESPEYEVGGRFYCPKDLAICSPEPLCGDGICDGREVTGGSHQCVQGVDDAKSSTGVADCPSKPQYCDDGSLVPDDGKCPRKPISPLLIFGLLGGAGVAAAIGLRLKKDGYFGK